MSTTTTKVGAAIRDARLNKLWHQSELADASGISERTISRIEVGLNIPTMDTVAHLARALERPLSDFAPALMDDMKAKDRTATVDYHRAMAAVPA